MSRIGKKPIGIPAGVTVEQKDHLLTVRGPKGELSRFVPPGLNFEVREGSIKISPQEKTRDSSRLWGLFRALLANMIEGVTEGFSKKLGIEGMGYRANIESDGTLALIVGFSHPVKIAPPEGITFSVERNVLITVSGIDKELVGEVAAKIRRVKPPEPYKGKGIRYEGEIVLRKAGKKAVVAVK